MSVNKNDREGRGYGREHKRMRARLAPQVATGTVRCARCGVLIAPNEPWDLDHDDFDRTVYLGASHSRCNRATAGRHGQPQRRWSREWFPREL
jgi:hypothetical protein